MNIDPDAAWETLKVVVVMCVMCLAATILMLSCTPSDYPELCGRYKFKTGHYTTYKYRECWAMNDDGTYTVLSESELKQRLEQ